MQDCSLTLDPTEMITIQDGGSGVRIFIWRETADQTILAVMKGDHTLLQCSIDCGCLTSVQTIDARCQVITPTPDPPRPA